ncbi:MAG: hypothetical protein HKN25_15370, partial [Pyrinomonadaceae bacterium]|nr:hypothetical protein [Pyrinomonadaceae bacterium]
ISESIVVLDEASSTYESDQLHPINLSISINKLGFLLWDNNCQDALEVMRNIEIPMELCEDQMLLARYHNQAGMLFVRIDKFDDARFHYGKAIEFARALENDRYVGNFLNNFAFGLVLQGNTDEANIRVDEAIEIFEDLNDTGWLAIALETKSQVQLKEHKVDLALDTIERSIELFEQGEYFGGLADALWVKTHILLRLGRKEDGFMQFARLTDLASREIGEYAVKKYAKAFSKIIYVKTGQGLAQEVSAFKNELLMESLTDVDADMTEAAKQLKISRKKLTSTISRQFPEIYLELGITRSLMAA